MKLTFRSKTWLDAKGVEKAVGKATLEPLDKCALEVERNARLLLSKGGGANKQPSAPGQPPHKQLGTLSANITRAKTLINSWIVGITPINWYGRVHEFGSRTHPKRPFLLPALVKSNKKFPEFFKNLKLRKNYK